MNRAIKRISLFCCAVFFCCCALPLSAFAADYTYTVTLSTGNQAKVALSGGVPQGIHVYAAGSELTAGAGYQLETIGENEVALRGLPIHAQITFEPQSVAALAADSKYYIRGVRLSGRDNSAVNSTSFEVTADADYMVAYGIKGELTEYTVNFLDASGNALAASRTYYGNVGDKPVVAYLYLDGYAPQSYNLTKTLAADSVQNVFTFTYSPLSALPGGETVIVMPQTGTGGTTGGGAGGGGAAGGGAAGGGTGTADDTAGAGDDTTIPDDSTPAADTPQDIIDLDDNETPLGNLAEQIAGATPVAWVTVCIGGAIVIIAVIAVVVLLRRRRKEK